MHFILDLLNGNLHIYKPFLNTDTKNVFMVLIAYRYYSFGANDFSNVIVGLYNASVLSTQTAFGKMYYVNGACQKPTAILPLHIHTHTRTRVCVCVCILSCGKKTTSR